jgi:hypothetical protein
MFAAEIQERIAKAIEKMAGISSESEFKPVVFRKTIHCNREHEGLLWYFWNSGEAKAEQVCPEHYMLMCIPRKLTWLSEEYKGKSSWKMLLEVDAASTSYTLKAGQDSHFTKGLMMALAKLSRKEMDEGIGIAPNASERDEKVLFCHVFHRDKQIFEPYSDATDFREVRKLATTNVNGIAPESFKPGEEF